MVLIRSVRFSWFGIYKQLGARFTSKVLDIFLAVEKDFF